MSRIDNALYEIHSMDTLAARDQWVNRVHPLVKLILTIVYIGVTLSFHRYDLAGVLKMGIYPIALFILGELAFKDALRRLRIILPLVCFVGLPNPFFDRQMIWQSGNFIVTTGMISMATLMVKGICSVLAAYLLIATTSIEKICYSLQLLHIPSVLITQILLTYRYVTVLLTEAGQVIQAYSLRAPGQKGVHFKVWGSLAGQLLLRSIDRAGEVYESMTLRGFRGKFYLDGQNNLRGGDIAYLVIFLALFLLLRSGIVV